MHQYRSAVDQVVGVWLQAINRDVVTARGNVGRQIRQVAEVDVACGDRARCTDAMAEPPCDRTRACTDLQAAPTGADAGLVQAADRRRVGPFLETAKSCALRSSAARANVYTWVRAASALRPAQGDGPSGDRRREALQHELTSIDQLAVGA